MWSDEGGALLSQVQLQRTGALPAGVGSCLSDAQPFKAISPCQEAGVGVKGSAPPQFQQKSDKNSNFGVYVVLKV